MAKLSVDQALLKAKSHVKKGKIQEAQELYEAVLQAFPKNKRAQQGLAALNKPKQPNVTQSPPQKQLINSLIFIIRGNWLLSLSKHKPLLHNIRMRSVSGIFLGLQTKG